MNEKWKVDFMIVGAQKCGTTSLTQLLGSHPSIVCCSQKEPMFFSSVKDWRNEISEYHNLFEWQHGALHFEASTSYTCYPHHNYKIWESLYSYNPDLKLIYVVRNPIDRIISSYMHSYQRGYIDLDIEQAIIEEPLLLNMTRYSTQIRPYIEQFGRDQVEIIFFEDFIENRTSVINQLFNFLGVSNKEFELNHDLHANKSVKNFKIHHKYDNPGTILRKIRDYTPILWRIITDNSSRSFKRKPQLSVEDQEMILNLLKKEIDELEEITNRDLSSWRKKKSPQTLSDKNRYHPTWYEGKAKLINKAKRKFLNN